MKTQESLRQKRLIKNFLEKYNKYYDYLELCYLKESEIPSSYKDIPDILRQILCELNLMEDKDNAYLEFANLIEKIYGLDKNIVEVGGGIIPSLSKIIALKQKKGTITVYDPRLIEETTMPNLITKKEKFTLNTLVPNANLFIGFMPQKATETIIEKACLEQKDFIITLCGDGISDEDDYYEDNEEFLHAILYLAKNKIEQANLGTMELTYLTNLEELYPVIYNKRH